MRLSRSPADIMARTRALLADNAVLRARLADSMARSAQVARLHPRIVRGASGPEPTRDLDALRRHVLGRLIEGSLPVPAEQVWAGAGSGNSCSVCGLLIMVTEIEYELRVGDVAMFAHRPCFDVWTDEAAALSTGASTGEDLPPDVLTNAASA
jgi:hypothetical protein